MTAVGVCVLAFLTVTPLDVIKENSGQIPAVFVVTKAGYSLQEVWPSLAICGEGNWVFFTGIPDVLTLTNCFFVPAPNQSISAALRKDRNRKLNLKQM